MSYAHEGDKRQKLIQWDEETIAEHDRERGSRYANLIQLTQDFFSQQWKSQAED
jgi:hypothetical protein